MLSELYYNNIVNLIQTNKVRHMQLCVIKITDSFVFSIGLIVTGLTSLRGACLIIVVYTSIVYTISEMYYCICSVTSSNILFQF